LFRAGASVTLVHRGPELKSTIKYWVRPDIENRIKEGSIAARFDTVVKAISPSAVVTERLSPRRVEDTGIRGEADAIPADTVFLLTGYRADADLLQRAGVAFDDRDAPVHDRDTFETNVSGLFVAGGAVAGVDTGTIFIENGRFHGERIVGTIASRL
jgi:thioredoxin reductase (NADPH)